MDERMKSSSDLGRSVRLQGSRSNITLERNGSLPNLYAKGDRTQIDKIQMLRFQYDEYLTSVVAKHVFQKIEKKLTSNINEQKRVFVEEFESLKQQLVTLDDELKLINKLKLEKQEFGNKIEALEMINKTIIFDDSDKKIMSLFISTASKVIVKNFKKMDETDLSAVTVLLNEIINSLKSIDYGNEVKKRSELKDLLVNIAMLTKNLDDYKLKCEEKFKEKENVQNYNTSLKILKDQYGENPDQTLLPQNSNLMEDLQKILDKNK